MRSLQGLLDRAARLGRWLLVAAAVLVAASGLVLALGLARPHTLMVYAAVALATGGVVLALPSALRTSPLTSEEPS
jgi:hypothetical protein